MQENHKASIGVSSCSHPEVVNPQCSCGECDSASCFTKRRADIPCSCGACKKSKSCLFYNTHATEKKSGSINFKDVEIELAIENLTKEFFKKEITCQFDIKNNQKCITRKQSRIRYKTVDANEQIKKEKDDNNAVVVGSIAADACCPEEIGKAVSESHSATHAYSCNEVNRSTAKLTAQVMDVPYKDFQNSLMPKLPNFPSDVNKISALDIFNRIKEVYKACSCKVCECIVGKSLQNGQCNCKPCECNDCTSFMKKEKSFITGKLGPSDDVGCPCVRCNRGSCKGIGKKKTEEGIKCDCVGLHRSQKIKSSPSFSKACNCVPCQCIECKPLLTQRNRSVVVAPVGEDNQQRNTCLCSPCECFNCGHGYSMAQNQHHEMSTGINRHPNCHCEMCANDACTPDDSQSCRCERQSRVMSKPFQRDSNDYDIRRATVTYNDRRKHTDDYNYDTIAMFAALTNNYPKVEVSKKHCDCDKCECLMCKYKANTSSFYNSSNLFDSMIHKYNTKSDCKCSPCECQFCEKQNRKELHGENLLCACELCDYLNCKSKDRCYSKSHEINKPISKFSVKADCRCDPCECNDCEKLMTTCIGDICQCATCKCINCIGNEKVSAEVIYPVKRGERLTPSIFSKKMKDSFIESCMNSLEINEGMLKQPLALKSSLRKPSAFSSVPSSRSKTRDDFVDEHRVRDAYQPTFSHNFRTSETVKHAHILKSLNEITLHTPENRNMRHTFEPILSSNSSISCIRESGTITSTSRNRQKSWESSCNSSGHDYPSYLIHFPKTTVETCLNDIIKLDNDNNSFDLGSSTALSSKTKHHDIPITTNDNNFSNCNNSDDTVQTEERKDFQYSAQNFENDPYIPQPVQIEFEPEQVSKPYSLEILTSSLRDRVSTKYDKYSISYDTFNNNLNISSAMVGEDYESVQNTLHEAREFSQQLVKLLEKYEKANREFKSVSKIIKRSNESLLNCVIKPELCEVPTKEHNIKSSNGSSTQELVEINKNAKKNKEVDFFFKREGNLHDENNPDISNDNDFNEFSIVNQNNQKENSNENFIKDDAALLKVISEENEPANITHYKENKKKNAKKINRNYCKMYRRSIVCSKRFKRFPNNSNIEVDNIIGTERSDQPINEQTIQILGNKDGDHHEIMKMPRTSHDFALAKQLNKTSTELRVSVKEKYTEGRVVQKDVIMIKQPMIKHNREVVEKNRDEKCSVLNMNFFMNSITRDERVDSFTPLEKNVKDTAKSISRQRSENEYDNTTYLYVNKALVKLHSEVKKLLDMPILHDLEETCSSIQKSKQDVIYNNLSNTASSQTSQEIKIIHRLHRSQKTANEAVMISPMRCEEMKVNFLHVRRVSYHTLLVKWDAPSVLDHVEGYELLVDGRPVTKLLDPGRRMVVVTCYPYSDKILLTVRTVVRPSCGRHSPAATVIYQHRQTVHIP